MEDIEYLEEYEDFILPKTLNYSEEFPLNAIEGDVSDETCNNLNPELPSDDPDCQDKISRTNKTNHVEIINSEVLRTPALVQNYNKESARTTSNIQLTEETQKLKFRYDRQNPSFLDRINQNPVLQKLDKYKSVATVKPTLQRTKTFKLSSISPPFASTDSKIQNVSNSECELRTDVNIFSKVMADDSFLDCAVEKHGGDNYNLSFNLETVEISDICSDSLNFSDDYNDDIYCLESILSSEDMTKLKLKRKNIHNTDLEINHKKSKYGNNFNSSKQMHKTGKQNVIETFSRKTSVNRNQLKNTPIHAEKNKSQIPVEKRKINSSGKKSKLVVKKNGKKFVFPDRSKFSLKNLNSSNNVEDETQDTIARKRVDVAPKIKINNNVGEINNELVNYSCTIKNNPLKISIEKQENMKSIYRSETAGSDTKNIDQEKVKEKDIVIFSSPKNIKRIDSEALIHQSPTTPIKSTGITFGHFSLKSIKPPSNLKMKELLPKKPAQAYSRNKVENQFEEKVTKTFAESEKCLNTSGKDNSVIFKRNESFPNLLVTCKKPNETQELSDSASNSNNKGKMLRTLENVLDSPIGKNDYSLENMSNNKKENSNTENANALDLREKGFENLFKENFFFKASNSIKKVNDTICSMDKTLKGLSKENDSASKNSPTKDKCLGNESNDLECSFRKNQSSFEKSVKIMSTNVIENRNSNKVNATDCSTEKSLGDSYKETNSLKRNIPNKNELLQRSENVLDCSISRNVSLMAMEKAVKKSLNKKNENKYAKKTNGVDRLAAENFENFPKYKFLVEEKLSNTSINAEKVNNKTPIFEPRCFDIRLSKSIVANLLKSAKTHTNPVVSKILDETKKFRNQGILMEESNVLESTSVCMEFKNSKRFPTELAETPRKNSKGKKEKKKKMIHSIVSVESSIKSFPLMPYSSENNISNLTGPTDGITFQNGKISVQNLPCGLVMKRTPLPQTIKEDSKQCAPYEISSDEIRLPKLSCILGHKPKVLTEPTSAEPQNTDLEKRREGNSQLTKNTRQTIFKSKENSQPGTNEVPVNIREKKHCSRNVISTSVALSDNCTSYQKSVQQKSTKSVCDSEIVEPKKELNEQTVVLQFRPTHHLTKDLFLNKIKLNETPETSIYKSSAGLTVCTSSINTFRNEQINPKFTIFELPAYIVMKTKIITREDLQTNKTLTPPIIKQQEDIESDSLTTESVIKTERFEFNSVCAQINLLLEQNANYLKFASGSERLTRMNDVIGDNSLSVEDANCTLKFLQSYLSSGPRDTGIKTRGQQFIPIYDSQKKIIGYRKRTIHVKSLSSRRNSRRSAKIKAQPPVSVTTMNIIRSAHIVEYDAELPPKIEPDLLDVGECELIVPDTSLTNDICIKNEENHME